MNKEIQVSLFDMIMSISAAMDLVSISVANHHKQVAQIAACLAAEMKLTHKEQKNVFLAGLLHDSGALSLKSRLDALQFEDTLSFQEHSETGYFLLRGFAPLARPAQIIRFHHVAWNHGKGAMFKNKRVPLESHLLHLADRIAVLIAPCPEILSQAKDITHRIKELSGKVFVPQLVAAFLRLAKKEHFWLDILNPPPKKMVYGPRMGRINLNLSGLCELARLLCQIIDFRSSFTATHSYGVAGVAEELAQLAGFTPPDAKLIKIAGYLHDLGKLAVPVEILEKPAKLTPAEYNVIKAHTFYTFRTLEPIYELHLINTWGAYHHERLDGKGYPFHLGKQDLSLGSQIMAVADVFTALTEDRPYRQGMNKADVLAILKNMSVTALNGDLVTLLERNYSDIDAVRTTAQAQASQNYQRFSHHST